MPCYAMLCYAELWHAVLCRAVPCCAVLCRAVPRCAVLLADMLRCTVTTIDVLPVEFECFGIVSGSSTHGHQAKVYSLCLPGANSVQILWQQRSSSLQGVWSLY